MQKLLSKDKHNNQGNTGPKILGVVALISLVFLTGWVLKRKFFSSNTAKAGSTSKAIVDQIEVNKSFSFSARTPRDRKPISNKINFTVLTAEKTKELKVKGETRTPPEGKIFLTLTLELENPYTKDVGFFSRDLVRLIVDEKPVAPVFYNSGLVIAPVAVKKDKVGFVADKEVKTFRVQIGELKGQKEEVVLEFKK